MISKSRRSSIRLAAGTVGATIATSMLPSSIRAALAIPVHRRHGNLKDVKHMVILMQKSRPLDHYFGTLKGVRGFGDHMAIPLPDGQRVWHQEGSKGEILSYHFDTSATSAQRVDGTPHTWPDVQQAWNEGCMDKWLPAKTERFLGYYKEQDIALQFAMANAFTICDAYHCSFQGDTNPNRLLLQTGTSDPLDQHGGPVTTSDHDSNGPVEQGYTWATYPERLQAAGITWRVYQDMADNFPNNPLVGFRQYRAVAPDSPLIVNGLSTWKLDALERDTLINSLPRVSWIIAPAKYSEHPSPSSPIWGTEYTSWVLGALTANPEVWSKTALLVMFDENDGFFDHVVPPTAPSLNKDDTLRGETTVDAILEWHTKGNIRYRNQSYGLGPWAPMYVISPWSKGGWVNSQVFDHTSVIRSLEQRFGIMEPNISPWCRTVCGDLTSMFSFANPNNEPFPELFSTSQADAIVASRIKLLKPKPPAVAAMSKQEVGIHPAHALPYELGVHARYRSGGDALSLTLANTGKAGAVFQMFDLLDSENPPKCYTVGARKHLYDSFQGDASSDYHLEVHSPNGFFRVLRGNLRRDLTERKAPLSEVWIDCKSLFDNLHVQLINRGRHSVKLTVKDNIYRQGERRAVNVPPGQRREVRYSLRSSGNWYNFSVSTQGTDSFLRRFSGRMEDGRSGFSDPGMGLGTLTF